MFEFEWLQCRVLPINKIITEGLELVDNLQVSSGISPTEAEEGKDWIQKVIRTMSE